MRLRRRVTLALAASTAVMVGSAMVMSASASITPVSVTVTVRPSPNKLPVSSTGLQVNAVVLPTSPCTTSCISVGNLAQVSVLLPTPCSNTIKSLPPCRPI